MHYMCISVYAYMCIYIYIYVHNIACVLACLFARSLARSLARLLACCCTLTELYEVPAQACRGVTDKSAIRPISLVILSLLRLLDSNFPANPLWV